MIEHSIKLVNSIIPETYIISKVEDGLTGFGVPVLKDDLAQQTPLAGVLRGLEEMKSWGLFFSLRSAVYGSRSHH